MTTFIIHPSVPAEAQSVGGPLVADVTFEADSKPAPMVEDREGRCGCQGTSSSDGGNASPADDPQLVLFDADEYLVTGAGKAESTPNEQGPLEVDDRQLTLFDPYGYPMKDLLPEERTRTDVLALALDPEATVRIEAAASPWNSDARLQRALATDPNERVVLALVEHADPSFEVCELIIDGPHVAARRQLAEPRRNLPTELLVRLAGDDDSTTRSLAAAELSHRTNRAAGYQRCAVCGSSDVERHVEGYRVWFSCNRCGAVFGQ